MPPSNNRQQHIVDAIANIYDTIPVDYNPRLRTQLIDGTNQIAKILQRFEPQMPARLDVGHGWLPMIIKLDQKLNILCPTYTISQVKEKFGLLRYYAHCTPFETMTASTRDTIYEAFYDLVHHAEYSSQFVCDMCGNHGKLHNDNGWFNTRCDTHACGSVVPVDPQS